MCLQVVSNTCGPGYESGQFYDTILPSEPNTNQSTDYFAPCIVRFFVTGYGDRVIYHCAYLLGRGGIGVGVPGLVVQLSGWHAHVAIHWRSTL